MRCAFFVAAKPAAGRKSRGECFIRRGFCVVSMGYKKDIFAVFAYEFELLRFLVKYRLTPK